MAEQQVTVVMDVIAKMDKAEAGFKKLQGTLQKLKLPDNLDNGFKKSFSNIESLFARYKAQLEKGFDTKADVTNFTKTSKAIDAELDRISKYFTELTGKQIDLRVKSDEVKQAEKVLQDLAIAKEKFGKETLELKIDGAKNGDISNLKTTLEQFKKIAGSNTNAGKAAGGILSGLESGNIEKVQSSLQTLLATFGNIKSEAKLMKFKEIFGTDAAGVVNLINTALQSTETEMGAFAQKTKDASDALANVRANEIEAMAGKIGEATNDFEGLRGEVQQTTAATQEYARATQSMTQQLGDLKQSTQYFFSLRNMLNLLKTGIREAVNTIKELDAVMTETAVVTNFSVGDMWEKLPEYTANANALGASVKDMYEATTLYYQQGLNTDQAMGIAAETMKMARIGGLEATDATDKMTAALRGFNMELNEVSAKRINDVYSNLAAKTASNTQELGTAMQRTASIAASAGMSFEGTSAFLAQAIETTREPAENLGTAMKTIVARFQELKKNPLEMTEVDGEEVDYNKVDTALKSIGVSLKDTNGQFRSLDQVFLEISERWDSLTQTQQRYIATTAAGSRQQSRFIAMMSNYDRTMELMDYANNAGGASDEQFGKTLESLEAKINQFQNAWHAFLMGIMNDSWTKGIVDAGTKILTIVNDIIKALSFGGNAKGIKSFLSLFTAFQGLKFAGRGINALIGGVGGALDKDSNFVEGFRSGLGGRTKDRVGQATNQIVQAINGLIPHIDKDANANTNQYKFQEPGQYGQARKDLMNSLGGRLGQVKKDQGTYTAGGVLDIINANQLNKKQQKQFFQASPGLKKNLTKSLANLYEEIGTDKETAQALVKGFKTGDLALEEALMGNDKLTTSFNKRYEEIGKQGGESAARAFWQEHYNPLYNEGIEKGLSEEEAQNYAKNALDNKKVLNEKGQQFLQNPQVLTQSQKIANLTGQVGAGFMAAGQAIQMFGAQLSQLNPVLGQAISGFGGLLTTAGSLANVIPSIIAGGPVAWGIAAAVTVIGGAVVALKAHRESIKQAGKEVVDTYNETNDELQGSIDSIKGYQAELARLSTGVDKNGFNINLDDSEFQRYKELVDDLVQQNPDIVKGWNSEGDAIIDVNSALKETIKLKQQELNAEKTKYLSNSSGRKLINARNEEKGYKLANSHLGSDGMAIANNIISSGLEDEAKAAGFDLEKIKQGDIQALSFLRDHYSLLENIYEQGGQDISDTLSNQMDSLTNNLSDYEEAISPVVDYLTEYVKEQNLFADLPVELTGAFNEGIKSIAGKDLSAGEMKKAANYLSLELRQAFEEATPYLDEADEALNQFTQDLNEDSYNDNISNAVEGLRKLAEEAEVAGQVEIAEWYENQASQIENALTSSTEAIGDYVNTLSDNIATAKTNFEALGEAVDDYYTLADQAHGLVETALSEKNTEGKGSLTFWNTYRGLASEDAYNKHDKDKAIADMQQFQKYFTEGAEGSRAFAQKMIDLQDKSFKMTGENGELVNKKLSDFFELADDGTMRVTDAFTNLTDEQYAQLASVFDLSADGFTAVLNKLRQFGDLNFSDPAGIRRAMALDDRVIKTEQTITDTDGEEVNRLYYGQSMLEAEMANEDEQTKIDTVNKLEAKGAIQLPSGAENLIKAGTGDTKDGSLLKQLVKDTKGKDNQVENVMKALVQSGEYDQDELKQIHTDLVTNAEKYNLADATDLDKSWDDMYKHIEDGLVDSLGTETNDHLTTISSTVDQIAGILAAGKVAEGYLPEAARKSDELYNEIVGEKGVNDTWIQQFAQGNDAKDNRITDADEYNKIETKLKDYQDYNNKYLEDLRAGRAAAEERGASPKELEAFDNEIAAAEHNAKLIEQYLDDAAKQWEISSKSKYAADNITDSSKTAINETSTENFNKEGINDVTAVLTNAFKLLRENPDITQEDKLASTVELLQTTASKLQEAGWDASQIQSFFKDNFKIDLALDENGGLSNIGEQISEEVNGQNYDLNATLTITDFNMPALASGQNNPNSVFHHHGTMARGSRGGYTIPGRPTLTGEEGEELVWEPKRNEAYMVGSNGPQFADISKDAVVWNADQTKRIKKNSKTNNIGTGARGIHHFGTMAGGHLGHFGTMNAGTTVPGTFNINAVANITEVTLPTEKPTIPVKADLQVENNKGGFLNKIFGGDKGGPSIDVAANVTTIKTGEQIKPLNITGNITEIKNDSTIDSINATATVTKVTKAPQVAGEPVSVKATASVGKVSSNTISKAQPKVGSQSMKVTANTSAAEAKIKKLINLFNKTYTLKYKASGPTSIKVPISANFTGPWTKKVTIDKAANGKNNHIAHRIMPSFGSAAKGNYGQLGPNGKGGLTLTGEKGYEIAWIPSENRSMILGVKGPQMLNLPKDAVVWTHEQSKKILKQQTIPAGSHSNNSATGSNIFQYLNVGSSSSSGNSSSSTAAHVRKAAEEVKKEVKKTTDKISRVCNWWENIARQTEDSQRKMDQNQQAFQSFIKEMQATLTTTGTIGKGNAYINSIGKYIGYNETQEKRANKELRTLNKSGVNLKGKKATSKKGQKKLKKAYNKGNIAIEQVSFTDKKGKSKTQFVDLSKYIKNGLVNDKALKRIKNLDKRKAVSEAANKALNETRSRRNSAEDAIRKAEEALKQMGKDLYETFFSWEIELTKIWKITQKIEQAQARKETADAQSSLIDARIASGKQKADGKSARDSLTAFRAGLKQQIDIIKGTKEAIDQNKADIKDAISGQSVKTALSNVTNKLNSDSKYDAQVAKRDAAKAAYDAVAAAKKRNKQIPKEEKKLREKIKKLEKKKNKSKAEEATLDKYKKQLTALNKEEVANNKIIEQESKRKAEYEKQQQILNSMSGNLNSTDRLAYEAYQKELKDQQEVIATANKYMHPVFNDDGTVTINFDTEAFAKAKEEGEFTGEFANKVQEYVKKIIDLNGDLENNYQKVIEEATQLYTSLSDLKEQWADSGDQLIKITEDSEKKKLDNLKKLSDSVKKALDDLLNKVKKALDNRRKLEDNAKTERDISQKQQRLAALRADTSGGHQVEIAQLEKEIADAQQDYQRSLEDQLLDKLQEQGEEAARQRERQIELQEAISTGVNNLALVEMWMANPEQYKEEMLAAYREANDYDTSWSGRQGRIDDNFESLYNDILTNQDKQLEVNKSIKTIEGIVAKVEKILARRNLGDIKTAHDNEYSLAEAREIFNDKPLHEFFKAGYTDVEDYINAGITDYQQLREAGFSTETLKKHKEYAKQAIAEENKQKAQLERENNKKQENLARARAAKAEADARAAAEAEENKRREEEAKNRQREQEARRQNEIADAQQAYNNNKGKKFISFITNNSGVTNADDYYNLLLRRGNKYDTGDQYWGKIGKEAFGNMLKWGKNIDKDEKQVVLDLVNTDALTWEEVVKAAKNYGWDTNKWKTIRDSLASNSAKNNLGKAVNKVYNLSGKKAFKTSFLTGGLANFTGPAWLDGTPSKPELVLNAKDTRNFITLRDILSKAMSSTGAVENTYGGDAMYEININVDKIEKDYDVDRVVEKVKKEITKGAGYRNVTQVRNFR